MSRVIEVPVSPQQARGRAGTRPGSLHRSWCPSRGLAETHGTRACHHARERQEVARRVCTASPCNRPRPLPAPRGLSVQSGSPTQIIEDVSARAPHWSLSSTQHASSENAVSAPNTAPDAGCLPCSATAGLGSPEPPHPNPRIPAPPHSRGLPAIIGLCRANERHKRFRLLLDKRSISYSDSGIITDFPFHDSLASPGRCSISHRFCSSSSEVAPGENRFKPAARAPC